MTAAAQTLPAESAEDSGVSSTFDAAAWERLRDDGDVQFAPVEIPGIVPPEPSWFERLLTKTFTWLADVFAPVGQLLGARPELVEPSSTACELAALPALPNAARTAFRTIAERADWEAARAAYADFALARLNGQRHRL